MINRLGWMRVASPNAYVGGALQGDLVNREFGLTIVSDDARLEEPVWVKCVGDKDIRAECSPFIKGKSRLRLTLRDRARSLAIVRLQAEWPGLPANHPYKRSPEYTYAIPIARDCDLVSEAQNAPRFLTHNGIWQENGPAKESGCVPTFKTYHCIDGVLKESAGERVCP